MTKTEQKRLYQIALDEYTEKNYASDRNRESALIVGIQNEILRVNSQGLLKPLLANKTTKENITWATDAYKSLGEDYQPDHEIKPKLITGEHSDVIKTRTQKELEK